MTTMEMNCEPGDLARIIRAPYPCAENLRDRIVRVLEARVVNSRSLRSVRIILPASDMWVDTPVVYWTYEGADLHCESTGHSTHCAFLADAILRPIRGGPGDDEVIQLVGKPIRSPETV